MAFKTCVVGNSNSQSPIWWFGKSLSLSIGTCSRLHEFSCHFVFLKAKLDLGAWCCIYKSNFHLSQIKRPRLRRTQMFHARNPWGAKQSRFQYLSSKVDSSSIWNSWVLRKRPKTNVNSWLVFRRGERDDLESSNWEIDIFLLGVDVVDIRGWHWSQYLW